MCSPKTAHIARRSRVWWKMELIKDFFFPPRLLEIRRQWWGWMSRATCMFVLAPDLAGGGRGNKGSAWMEPLHLQRWRIKTAKMGDVKASFRFFSPPSFKTVSAYLLSCHRCTKMYKRGCAQVDLIQVSLPLSCKEAFTLSRSHFEAHNSVWKSLWSIVNYRTGCPFGTSKILGGL